MVKVKWDIMEAVMQSMHGSNPIIVIRLHLKIVVIEFREGFKSPSDGKILLGGTPPPPPLSGNKSEKILQKWRFRQKNTVFGPIFFNRFFLSGKGGYLREFFCDWGF